MLCHLHPQGLACLLWGSEGFSGCWGPTLWTAHSRPHPGHTSPITSCSTEQHRWHAFIGWMKESISQNVNKSSLILPSRNRIIVTNFVYIFSITLNEHVCISVQNGSCRYIPLYNQIILHESVFWIISILFNILQKHNLPVHERTIIYSTCFCCPQFFIFISSAHMDNFTTLFIQTSRLIFLEETPLCRLVPSKTCRTMRLFLSVARLSSRKTVLIHTPTGKRESGCLTH